MKRFSLFFILMLTAHPVLAVCGGIDRFTITPSRPTVSDDIEVVLTGSCPDGCVPSSPRVTVANNAITIDLITAGGCILVPSRWGERISVGQVPGGTYALVVRNNSEEIGRQTLVVREPPLLLKPSFGSAGSTVLLSQRQVRLCDTHPCVLPSVTFGGAPATAVRLINDDTLAVDVPAHDPGLVDVIVTDRHGHSVTAHEAFLYPDAMADLSGEYERILFPVVFEGPGAHGSEWRAENVMLNRGPIAVPTLPPFPNERRLIGNEAREGGLFFLVPHGLEEWLAYSSHIADRSRLATDAGTELRVVHEKDGDSVLTILNVPLTAESRQKLRIYDLDAIDGRAVTISAAIQGRSEPVLFGTTLQHTIVCITTPCYPEHPTYAVIDLDAIPQLRNAGVADFTIRATTREALLWAFVSLTNNDTQHVTTYTPQR